jgi:hypothetical protein
MGFEYDCEALDTTRDRGTVQIRSVSDAARKAANRWAERPRWVPEAYPEDTYSKQAEAFVDFDATCERSRPVNVNPPFRQLRIEFGNSEPLEEKHEVAKSADIARALKDRAPTWHGARESRVVAVPCKWRGEAIQSCSIDLRQSLLGPTIADQNTSIEVECKATAVGKRCAAPSDRSFATVGKGTLAIEQCGSTVLDRAFPRVGGVALGVEDREARYHIAWHRNAFRMFWAWKV